MPDNLPLIRSYWWGNDLDWSYPADGMTIDDICDGAYHTVESRYDGVYRYIVFDGVVRASVVAVGTHANRDDNLCLGAANDNGTPFTGTLRNFR